jgi:hypothetical protein
MALAGNGVGLGADLLRRPGVTVVVARQISGGRSPFLWWRFKRVYGVSSSSASPEPAKQRV